jgi:hypothetical protein
MSNILHDTRESLAAAIARLEIQRLRIEKLKAENVHLRNVLRAHNINPGEEAAEDAEAAATVAAPARGEADTKYDAQEAGEAQEPINFPVEQGAESHNILIHTRVENTVAKVRLKHECLDAQPGAGR